MFTTQAFLLVCTCALTVGLEFLSSADISTVEPSTKRPSGSPPKPPGRERRSTACSTTTALSDADQQLIVTKHNDYRSQEVLTSAAAINEIEWNDDLAGPAQAWADQCVWNHGNTYKCGGGGAGQNMGLRTGGAYIANDMSAWYSEKNDYIYETDACSTDPCRHYTQMVWDTTTEIGCGVKLCPSITISQAGDVWTNATLFVCNYFQPGNTGRQPFNLGSPCTDCKTSWPSKLNPFTCSSQSLCVPHDVISDATCKLDCVSGTRGATDCSCTCASNACGEECDTDFSCVHGSRTGNDCKCNCNSGYCGSDCNTAKVDDTNDAGDYDCNWWADQGYCVGGYASWMKNNCGKACGYKVCPLNN